MRVETQPSPIVSIIVITYNRSALLEKCLARLAGTLIKLKQFPLEVIVADNFSDDDTEAVCNAWQQKFQESFPIRLIRHPRNLGANPSFFSALRFTKGKYTFFMGDDDGLVESGLQRLLSGLSTSEPFSVGVEGDFLNQEEPPIYLPYQELMSAQKHLFKSGSFFYKVGNGYCGLYNVAEMKRILEDPEDPSGAFEGSNWGQSSLAGLLAAKSSLPVAVLAPGYGKVFLERPFAQGGLSIAASLEGMIDAATNLRKYDESAMDCLTGLMSKFKSPVNTHLYILLGTTPRGIETQVTNIVRRVRRKIVETGVEIPLFTRFMLSLVSLPHIKALMTETKVRLRGIDVNSAKFHENHY